MPCSVVVVDYCERIHSVKLAPVYSSVETGAGVMSERCRGHMKLPLLDAEAVSAVLVLSVDADS